MVITTVLKDLFSFSACCKILSFKPFGKRMVSGDSFLGTAFIDCFMAARFILFMLTKVR